MQGDTRKPFVHPSNRCKGWNPETGESQVFDSPEEREEAGWLDHHPNDEEKGGPSAKADAPDKDPPMERSEVIAALKEGGVRFNESANTKQLDNALKAALRKALTAAGRASEFDKNTSTRDLLALVKGKQAQ